MRIRRITGSLLVLFAVFACGDNGQAEKARLDAMRTEAARMEAMRQEAVRAQLEAARLQAERMDEMRKEAEKARLEQEAAVKRQDNARNYARRAGEKIVSAIGGGRDLIVNHQLRYFDKTAKTLEIAMEVSFNGAFWRSNNYQVSGVLTVNENGRNAEFARQVANQLYMRQERIGIITGVIVIVGGAYVLSEMNEGSTDTPSKNKKSAAATWDIRELELCNGLGTGSVSAAYAFNENGKRYTRGWFVLEPNKCATFKSVNAGKKVFTYATSESRVWSGDELLCIDMTNAFKLPQSGGSCTDGSTAKGFFAMKFTKPGNGHMKITFDATLDRQIDDFMAAKKSK